MFAMLRSSPRRKPSEGVLGALECPVEQEHHAESDAEEEKPRELVQEALSGRVTEMIGDERERHDAQDVRDEGNERCRYQIVRFRAMPARRTM